MKRFVLSFGIIFLSACSSTPEIIRAPAAWFDCYQILDQLVYRGEMKTGFGAQNFSQAAQLDELESLYGNESFFQLQSRLSNSEIRAHNDRLVSLAQDAPRELSDMGTPKALSLNATQAQELYQQMTQTPCVLNDRPYQRPGVSLGYCFGRAIISHFHALRREVHPEAMKKIWVVGPMRGDWGHHVAFMVRADDGRWWVIDNVTGLVTHDTWVQRLKGFQKEEKELMFFISEASRFGPEGAQTYNTIDLFNVPYGQWGQFGRENDYYRGFFHDFFEYLDQESLPASFVD